MRTILPLSLRAPLCSTLSRRNRLLPLARARISLLPILLFSLPSFLNAQSAKWVISPKYTSIEQISPGLYEARNQKGKKEYISNKGETIKKKSKFDPTTMAETVNETLPDSLAVYSEKNLYGYRYGDKVMLPAQFKSAKMFEQGFAIAETQDGFGVLRYISDTLTYKVVQNEQEDKMDITVFSVTVPKERSGSTFRMNCMDSTGLQYDADGKSDGCGNMLFTLKTFRERRKFTISATDKKGTLALQTFIATHFDTAPQPTTDTNAKAKSKTKNKKSKSKSKRKKG